LLRAKLVNREIKSKIVITNEDIKTYYDSHGEKYGGETKYHLRNILMVVSGLADAIEKRRVKEKMEAVHAKIKDGEPFENMVAAYSESPLASEGGDLGLFALDKLSPTLGEAVKDLKAGELTPVLDTEHGYQIFLVQEVIQTPVKPLEKVTPEIERILFDKIVDERFQAWLEELREHSHIKIIK
jgi:peptidyl-prolyl cis-trans isomerase SurA